MRSVIRKPPTMLLVAATTAMNPSVVASVVFCSPTSTIAPTTAMASRALVSDIRGVCSRGETRRMTSNPMNPASTNMKSASIRFELLPIDPPVERRSGLRDQRRQSKKLPHPRIDDFSAARHERLADNFIGEIQIQFFILDDVEQEIGDVLGIHLAGV